MAEEQKMSELCSNLINKRCNYCSLLKKLSFENKVLEKKLKASYSEYRALRDACPQEILEKLQVDYSKVEA